MADALTGTPTPKDVVLKQKDAGWDQTFEWPSNLNMGSYSPASGDTVTLTYNSTTSKVDVAKKS